MAKRQDRHCRKNGVIQWNRSLRDACDKAQKLKNWRRLSDQHKQAWGFVLQSFPVVQQLSRDMKMAVVMDIFDNFFESGLLKIKYRYSESSLMDEFFLELAPIEVLEVVAPQAINYKIEWEKLLAH